MKFEKVYAGLYRNGQYEIRKYGSSWEVWSLTETEPLYRGTKVIGYRSKFVGYKPTLRGAKELCKPKEGGCND